MQLPVDIPKLLAQVSDIEEARTTPLSISLYLDETAPVDVVAHVRSAFASSVPTVRMTISYVGAKPAVPYPADDMAVIVAGLWDGVGQAAEQVRAAGVPVMVATTLPSLVAQIAQAAGHPIPDGDICSPEELVGTADKIKDVLSAGATAALEAVAFAADTASVYVPAIEGIAVSVDAAADANRIKRQAAEPIGAENEPYILNESLRTALDLRMGQWIVAACHEKRLAFCLAFPFVSRALAAEAVSTTALENAGIGVLPFVPKGADLPLMTLNQTKMVLQIAAAYGCPMGPERVKELVAVIGCAFASRSVARTLVGALPPLKPVVSAGVGYSATTMLGQAMMEYFQGGQNAQGLGRVLETAFSTSSDAFEKVRGVAADQLERRGIDLDDVMGKVAGIATKAAKTVAANA